MPRPQGCPFCDLGTRVIKENEHANLFLSNPRKVEGHTLVTPKRHIETPWELRDEELVAIFGLIRFAQERLAQMYGGGSDVRQHYRPHQKQGRIKVDHIHYHVIPRTLDDELYQKAEVHEVALFAELSEQEKQKVTKLFE